MYVHRMLCLFWGQSRWLQNCVFNALRLKFPSLLTIVNTAGDEYVYPPTGVIGCRKPSQEFTGRRPSPMKSCSRRTDFASTRVLQIVSWSPPHKYWI